MKTIQALRAIEARTKVEAVANAPEGSWIERHKRQSFLDAAAMEMAPVDADALIDGGDAHFARQARLAYNWAEALWSERERRRK